MLFSMVWSGLHGHINSSWQCPTHELVLFLQLIAFLPSITISTTSRKQQKLNKDEASCLYTATSNLFCVLFLTCMDTSALAGSVQLMNLCFFLHPVAPNFPEELLLIPHISTNRQEQQVNKGDASCLHTAASNLFCFLFLTSMDTSALAGNVQLLNLCFSTSYCPELPWRTTSYPP